MTEAKTRSNFPAAVRAKPEYLVGELGRHAVHYLLDRLFRCLVWGADPKNPGTFELVVLTDSTLKVERRLTGQRDLFGRLGADWPEEDMTSLMAACFQRCLAGIRSGQTAQHDWVSGNPFLTVFLPVSIALSLEGKVTLTSGGKRWSQSYEAGEPKSSVIRAQDPGADASISLEFKLDAKMLGDELQVYPFRIRLREFASLVPGLEISLKYKSFKTLNFKSDEGITDLLYFFVPLEDRLHEEPFTFHYQEGDFTYECSIFLIHSAMERFKAFVDFDESYHGGVHERVLRKTIRTVLRRLCKLEIPVRRQSLDNIASSRMSYFGQFGSTVPYQRDQRKNQHVRTVPGVAATLRVSTPEVEWETNFRARLEGPKMEKIVGPKLDHAFRNWLLGQSDTIETWRKQWIPKKRRSSKKKKKKAQAPKEPSNLKDIDKVMDDKATKKT